MNNDKLWYRFATIQIIRRIPQLLSIQYLLFLPESEVVSKLSLYMDIEIIPLEVGIINPFLELLMECEPHISRHLIDMGLLSEASA